MTIQLIKLQIEKFLSDEVPSILAICGKWGVGKTHFWNRTVKELINSEERFCLPRYGYVSLFGINSLENLKSELFTATVDRQLVGKNLSDLKNLQNNQFASLKEVGKRLVGAFGSKLADTALKNSSTIVESLCFATIRKSVICIDDLERRSSKLILKDVLGLASHLKEQKKCKVVFLLNDGEEGLEDFEKYHEKVIDLKLRFEPTAEDCVEIAIQGKSDERIYLRELFCKLNVTNIRTIKKIERVVDMTVPLLKEFDPEIVKLAIRSIVLFGWCHYRANDPNIPTVEHVMGSGYARLGLGDSKNKTNEEKLWNGIIQQYGYSDTDRLDRSLLKGFTDGYLLEDEVRDAALEKNTSFLATKSKGSFSEAWDVFHDSLADNQDEVVTAIFQSFKDNINHISPINFNGMVTLFRELEENAKADEAIELYVMTRDPKDRIFDLSLYAFAGDITDEKIRKRFAEIHESALTKDSLSEVLQRLIERSGWNLSDEYFLSERSIDEFVDFFQNSAGPQLSEYVTRCLQFGRYSNASDQQKKIGENVSEALKRLAQNSKINKLRLKRYGISMGSGE